MGPSAAQAREADVINDHSSSPEGGCHEVGEARRWGMSQSRDLVDIAAIGEDAQVAPTPAQPLSLLHLSGAFLSRRGLKHEAS